MELVEPVLHQDRGLILYSFLNDATIFIAIFIAMSLETDKNVYLFHPCSDKKEPHEIERDDKLFHSNAVLPIHALTNNGSRVASLYFGQQVSNKNYSP